jgi:hypothetical protein
MPNKQAFSEAIMNLAPTVKKVIEEGQKHQICRVFFLVPKLRFDWQRGALQEGIPNWKFNAINLRVIWYSESKIYLG